MLILISIFHLGAKPSIRVAFHKHRSSRAEKLARLVMQPEMQSKHVSLTICPKTEPAHPLCPAHDGAARQGGGFFFSFSFFVENWVIISSLCLFIQKNHCPVSLCFLTALFRWVLHCSLSHVYWPKPQCEIQNNCSPQLPWHPLAHCTALFGSSRKSNWDRIFQK